MVDDNDARVARVEYEPYGTKAATLGDVPGVLFTGKPWDEDMQMYAFPYRYYSPDSSRWLTRDPLGMVDGPNMYAYLVNDPINMIDELGLYGYKCTPSGCGYASIFWCYMRLGFSTAWPDGCGGFNCWCCLPTKYNNCELCWLNYNRRVVRCAQKPKPLCELRAKARLTACLLMHGCIGRRDIEQSL